MADPYLGEIQAFPYGFVPRGWALCDGSVLAIRSNTPLYTLIGTTYGGDGASTFGLPNLGGCVMNGQGQGGGLANYVMGEKAGVADAPVSVQQIPLHVHRVELGPKSSPNSTVGPSATSNVAIDPGFNGFVPPPANAAFAPSAVVPNGGSQSHPNQQPTLALMYCIALDGQYPQWS